MYFFWSLTELRELKELWMTEYSDERPRNSVEGLTWKYPAKHLRRENLISGATEIRILHVVLDFRGFEKR